ncbi:MAG: hypothetical protein KJ718_06370 [Nanoarchaeota archaeon]|nr:hypothetical protein [Nanoarchaeota archaeon]MBU1052142.1 hypothetical protein [Nanoarchaeota archaeon]MBU1988701.1 hypothetical protein [Nanoarchaeota archaeon]
MKILIYSFEPFNVLKNNPAYEIAKEVHGLFKSKNVGLIKLPTTYGGWAIVTSSQP